MLIKGLSISQIVGIAKRKNEDRLCWKAAGTRKPLLGEWVWDNNIAPIPLTHKHAGV